MPTPAPPVGVLALQGDFDLHLRALASLGARARTVRTAAELDGLAGLVIPGGESTTMLKLIEYKQLREPLLQFGRLRPIFGTCAGAILLAAEVGNPPQPSLGLLDIVIERNAYGRQVDSRIVRIPGHHLGGDAEIEAVFIRAPIIRRAGPAVRVLASYDGNPILVEQGRHLAATYHPELTADLRTHTLFLSKLTA